VLGNCIPRATFAKPSAYFAVSLPCFFPPFQRLKRITDAGATKMGSSQNGRASKRDYLPKSSFNLAAGILDGIETPRSVMSRPCGSRPRRSSAFESAIGSSSAALAVWSARHLHHPRLSKSDTLSSRPSSFRGWIGAIGLLGWRRKRKNNAIATA